MPLPEPRSKWFPSQWLGAFDRYRLNEAIWLNNTETLSAFFRGGNPNTEDGRRMAGLMKRGALGVDMSRRWNWGRWTAANERRTDLPIPIGASIAELSAAQLMAEAPRFRFVDEEGKTVKGSAQARLDTIANGDDPHMTLLEGAQVAAAIGGAVLKAQWDTADPDRESVWFDVVGADCALPEFNSAGRLNAVTLFQEYAVSGAGSSDKVYRHFERHSLGMIEHALYLGTSTTVGTPVPLDRVEELEGIAALPNTIREGLTVIIPTGLSRLTAAFWRNRTTRIWRRSGTLANLGRSDFELIEPVIDAYSEAWAAMMRDVRLGKARAFVPVGALERIGTAGQGAVFDPDREFYQEVGGLDPEAGADSIRVEQPTIRWEEHMRVLAGLKTEILDGAGWSMSSFGQPAGVDQRGGTTATEVVDRTTKSERTRDEKSLMFKGSATGFFRMLNELDAALYPSGGSREGLTLDLAIDFPDVSQVDPEKQARQFLDLSSAHAISIKQTIRERRPNWDEEDVDAEYAAIMADMDAVTPEPIDPTTLGRVPGDDENAPPEVEPDEVEEA